MRYVKAIIATIIACVIFSSCNTVGSGQYTYFGFKTSVFTVIDEKDTHGGFQGEGYYYLILDCSEKSEQAKEIVQDWKSFPLTDNLQKAMYGGGSIAQIAQWPVISNGVYKFLDRHLEAVEPSDDTDLFNRYSYNFSVAVYDLDTNTLYYFEFDT